MYADPEESNSGAILFDEAIRLKTTDGTPIIKIFTDAQIIPGMERCFYVTK